MTRHTLAVLLENKPDALTRVAALFARRSFNIHSLAVGPTEYEGISRMTIVVDVDELPLEQVTKQLNKLVNIIKIVALDPETSVQRELLLVKIAANDETRTAVLQLVELFRARIVDVVPDAVTVDATGSAGKVEALLTALAPYGIKEIVQSGAVAISRGPRSLSERVSAERALRRA